jgi:precorrin-6Y C5,15-methyltransferase (decarboxylating)
MFFGIGRRVVEEFGSSEVEIIPDLSSVQVAFALIKEPWSDAFMMSLHGGPDPVRRRDMEHGIEDIPLLLEDHGIIAILTDRVNNPSVIAKSLAGSALSAKIIVHVCEKLGYPEERVVRGSAEEIASQSFAEPNVMIIKKV